MRRVVGVIAIIVGVLLGLTGAAAAAIVGPDNTITTATHRLAAPPPSLAIASAPGLIRWAGPTLHLQAQSRDRRPIFLGVGHADDVDSYLGASSYQSIYRITLPWRTAQQPINHGTPQLAKPAMLDFWVASALGPARQSLAWRIADGDWRLVLLNADARPGVDVDISVGVQVNGAFLASLGVLAIGVLLVIGGALLRRRRQSDVAVSEPAWSQVEAG